MKHALITVCGITRVSTLNEDGWWDWAGKMKVKTDNWAPIPVCKVIHKENQSIKGKCCGWGLNESSFVYVFWYNLPAKLPMPPALESIHNLILL